MRTDDNDYIFSDITWYILYRKLRSGKKYSIYYFVSSDLFVYGVH